MRAIAARMTRLRLKSFHPRITVQRDNYYLPPMIEDHVPKQFPCVTLLPEVDVNPEIDEVLKPDKNGFPQFDKFDLYCTYMGMGKFSWEHPALIEEFVDRLEDDKLSVDEAFKLLDELCSRITFSYNCARLINTTQNQILSAGIFRGIQEHALESLEMVYHSKPFLKFLKKMEAKGGLNAWEARLVEKFKSEHKNAGCEIEKSSRTTAFNQVHGKIEGVQQKFMQNLQACLGQFFIIMNRPALMGEFPPRLKKVMAAKAKAQNIDEGPWGATLDPLMYPKVLEYCPDKLTRFSMWKANIALCSHALNRQYTNHNNVMELRKDRDVLAKIHGFNNYVELALQTRMASSQDEVLSLIADIGAEARQTVTNEADALRDVAAANGQENPLEACDVPFWLRQQKKMLYSIDEDALRDYFPFKHVWNTTVSFFSDLFGIKITECAPGEISTYHPDVRTFKVFERDGTPIGTFYLDSYARPGQKIEDQMGEGYIVTVQSKTSTQSPLVAVIYNFPEVTDENPQSLLTVPDVRVLFSVFGQALQSLLSKSPYVGLAGTTNVEWDTLDMVPKFMKYWLHDPRLLRKLSRHHVTGEALSESTVSDLIASYSVGSGFRFCEDLLRSHYDIRLHSEETQWLTILRELWPQYSPFVFDETHSMATWFTDIFVGPLGGGYYGRLWSDMLAADTYNVFREAAPETIPELGLKYREAFLSTGGGRSTAASFHEFMGRDPNLEALFQLNKLV